MCKRKESRSSKNRTYTVFFVSSLRLTYIISEGMLVKKETRASELRFVFDPVSEQLTWSQQTLRVVQIRIPGDYSRCRGIRIGI